MPGIGKVMRAAAVALTTAACTGSQVFVSPGTGAEVRQTGATYCAGNGSFATYAVSLAGTTFFAQSSYNRASDAAVISGSLNGAHFDATVTGVLDLRPRFTVAIDGATPSIQEQKPFVWAARVARQAARMDQYCP